MSRNKWLLVILGMVLLPLCALFLYWQQAAEAPQPVTPPSVKAAPDTAARVPLDERVGNLWLWSSEDAALPFQVEYQNGRRLHVDALGVLVMTWEEHQQDPARLATVPNLKQDSFPVVVFFNVSGFDASGAPATVRRVTDGFILYSRQPMPVRLRLVRPLRGGTFLAYPWAPASGPLSLSEEEWYTTYMGMDKVEPKAKENAPKSKSKSEVEAPPSKTVPTTGPAGLRGKVLLVGGRTEAVQPLQVRMTIFSGKVSPKDFTTNESAALTNKKIVATLDSAADGTYRAALPPGTYTVIIFVGEHVYGNSSRQDVWPSVEVKDGWTDYDMRKVP